ncbi:MAG: Si-specific NAD(P)(+) transhydrogenase [Pseudomonadota bacterium]|nr:Si-specific NAD(P)(+) transhydrogenase [Pseudomonadota bacterium]
MAPTSPSHEFDLVCIGSGPAGQRAAVQAAKLRKRVCLVERDIDIGGVCLHTGTIPSKTFREAVLSFKAPNNPMTAHPRETAANGTARPTAERLLSRVGHIVHSEARILQDQMRRNGVEVVAGEARFTGPNSIVVRSSQGQREISASNVVIAVGTRPQRTIQAGVDLPMVITSDEILGLKELPRSMIVIGAGVIGIEYASMFANLGSKVTVIDGRERPLEFLDGEIVDEMIHQLRKHMVTFRMGEIVNRIERREGPPEQAVVFLESGKRMVADLVLACTGRVGASDFLDLQKAGLEADDRGRIKVDQQFRSVVPHIFAAGDVIGYPSLAATSSEQGRLAACHAFGIKAEPMSAHFPIGIYAIPEISMAGETEAVLTKARVPYETGTARYREIARGQILGDDSGMLKLIFHAETRKLLGVHVIGTGATELVHIGQAVLSLGGGVDYFLNTVFNYPTLAECYKVAALDAHNKMML